MGVTLYPVEDGDEDKYEIFNVTSDVPWTPRVFQRDSRIFNTTNPGKPTPILQDIHLVSDTSTFYDPGDADLPSLGHPGCFNLIPGFSTLQSLSTSSPSSRISL